MTERLPAGPARVSENLGTRSDFGDARRRLLEMYQRGNAPNDGDNAPIPRRKPGEPVPLSLYQQQIWLHAQMQPDRPIYNEVVTIHRRGSLNPELLERSFSEIVRRHEMWRTTFELFEGSPIQKVQAPEPVRLPHADLRSFAPSQRKREALRIAAEDARTPFDLARGPLWRARVVQISDEEHEIFLVMHQIIMDAVTVFQTLLAELAALYDAFSKGEPSPLAEPAVQYGDFAVWQRQQMTPARLASQLNYWRTALAGDLPVLDWPNERPRPAVQSFKGATECLHFEKALVDSLKLLGAGENVTLFMLLVAGFAALLHRYTGETDIILGTPIGARRRRELARVFGYFVNPLALRVDLSGDPSFRDLLPRVRSTVLGAIANADVPFEWLVKETNAVRSPSRNPLFQLMISLEPPLPQVGGEWDLSVGEISCGTSKLDMYLNMEERPDGLSAPIIYNPDLFDAAAIRRMFSHLGTLLRGAVSDPSARLSELPLLTEAERTHLLVDWNGTAAEFPQDTCIHELFEQQVRRTPNAVALVFEGATLSYGQLNARANQLAHHLRALGVKPDSRVAICLERRFEMVIALLAVLKAGGAYVPLDPSYPAERLHHMLADSQPVALLLERGVRPVFGDLPKTLPVLELDQTWQFCADQPHTDPGRAAIGLTASHLAYVIYTSGSTGAPKGAMNEHRAVSNRLAWTQRAYRLDSRDAVLQKTSFSFDVSVWEFFWPLFVGARLVIAKPGGHKDPAYLCEVITRNRITTMHFVPSMLQVFLEQAEVGKCSSLVRVLCSGEALPATLVRRFQQWMPAVELHNLYGPTEAAVDVTAWACPVKFQRAVVPIGRPIANTRIYILDGRRQPVPVGVAGELYIGGVQVARGYLNRPELTAERFLPDAFAEQGRMYRTGDLARWLPDGTIEYLGRNDSQVKLRGFRIELGEIETALAEQPGVLGAAAAVRQDRTGEKFIAAYIIPDPDCRPEAEKLRDALRRKLPDYMVPSRLAFLSELPLSPNGKIDRRKLPDVDAERPGSGREFVAPRNDLERKLAQIWEAILGHAPIGVRDNFFELGGHSLLGTRMLYRVEKATGARLALAALFTDPTIEQLAATIAREKPDWHPPVQVIPLRTSGSRPPFFCVCFGTWPMYRPLLRHLDEDQPFYGLDLDPSIADHLCPPYRIEDVAEHLARAIREQQPEGPYYIGGYCISGILAFETARVLAAQGAHVELVTMFLSYNPAPQNLFSNRTQANLLLRRVSLRKIVEHLRNLWRTAGAQPYLRPRVNDFTRDLNLMVWLMTLAFRSLLGQRRFRDVREILFHAAKRYNPGAYSGRVVLLRSAEEGTRVTKDPFSGWGEVAHDIEMFRIPGDDIEIFDEPNVAVFARTLNGCIKSRATAAEAEEIPLVEK